MFPLPRPSLRGVAPSLAICVGQLAIVGCGLRSSTGPLALTELAPGYVEILTTCADGEVTASVTESATLIEFRDVRARWAPTDECLGFVEVRLSAPIGSRTIEVDGQPWHRLQPNCSLGEYGPSDLPEEYANCRVLQE